MRIDEYEFRDKNGNEIEPTKSQLVIYIKSLHKQLAELKAKLREANRLNAKHELEKNKQKHNNKLLEDKLAENSQLLLENEELKAEINSYKEFWKTNCFRSKDDFLGYVVNTMMTGDDKANLIRELKAENESLRQQNERVLHKLELMVDVDQENERMKVENERLKARNNELKDDNANLRKDMNKEATEYLLQIQQQLKEKDDAIQGLQEINQSLGQTCENDRKEITRLENLVKEKDEEIERLKTKLSFYENFS